MTTIYLTRHGQTEWNLEKRLQGWKNSPLTPLGIKQAVSLGKRLENVDLDVIYTSPIERAYKTSEIIRGDRDIEIITQDGLKELNFGGWEGCTIEEVNKNVQQSAQLYNLFNNPSKYIPFDGETYEEIMNRINKTMDEIIEKNKDKKVLIVTHGISLKILLCYFTQEMNLEDTAKVPVMGQASLTQININEDEYEIVLKNDTSHYDKTIEKTGW